jgi:hypothetical protein
MDEPGTHELSIAISRDGQLIYLTPHSDESDIWLLDLP